MPDHLAIPNSNSLLARYPVFAPQARPRRRAKWEVAGVVEIDDILTECDCDLIEFLLRHGEPKLLASGEIGCRYSLYDASRMTGQSRSRILERIRRRQKTLIRQYTPAAQYEYQIFGETLTPKKAGMYGVTFTRRFSQLLLGAGVLLYYRDLVDDILAISSPVVRRIVRRTLSHDMRFRESLENIYDDIQYGVSGSDDTRRRMRDDANRDIFDAAEYLEVAFGIVVQQGYLDEFRRRQDDVRVRCATPTGVSDTVARSLGYRDPSLGYCGPESPILCDKNYKSPVRAPKRRSSAELPPNDAA